MPLFTGWYIFSIWSLKNVIIEGILFIESSNFLVSSFNSFFLSPNLSINNPLATGLLESVKAWSIDPPGAVSVFFIIETRGIINEIGSFSILIISNKLFILSNLSLIFINSFLAFSALKIALFTRDRNLL